VARKRRAPEMGDASNPALRLAACVFATSTPRPELERQLALASHELDLA